MSPLTSNPFIGLSLHPERVCLVEMEEGQIQAIGARELIQPINVETFYKEGQFFENQDETIQELYQKTGAKSRELGVVLEEGMVLIKKVPLALGLEEDMLKESLRWEASQCIVSPLDEYILEYQRLPFQTSLGNPLYLIILLRKSLLEGICTLVEKSGLSLREVDVDVFSSVRTLLANYDVGSDETAVIVDVQRQYITFIFIRQKEYFLSHRVNLQEAGSNSKLDDSSIVNALVKELKRLIFGHRVGRGIEDLNRIFLIGGENLQKVAHELSTAVSVSLETVNPFQRVPVTLSVSQSKEFNNFPERFVAAVGITLKKVPAPA